MPVNNKPLVVFAIPSLVGGGAERVVVNLANQFSCNGYGVHILLLSGDKSSPYASQIDDRVEIVSLRSKQKQYNIFLKMLLVFPLLCKLMKYFQRHKPALIFANLCAPQIILASSLSETNPPVVIIEHSVAFPPNSVKTIRNRVIHILMACSYPKARKFVGVSRGVMNDFLSRGYVFVDQVTYIYNPIITTQIRKAIENKIEPDFFKSPYFFEYGKIGGSEKFSPIAASV